MMGMSIKDQLIKEIRDLRECYMEIERVIPFERLLGENIEPHPKNMELLRHIEIALNGSKRIESILKKGSS